jgi:hypothetical protein
MLHFFFLKCFSGGFVFVIKVEVQYFSDEKGMIMKDLDGFQAWLGNFEVNLIVLSFYHMFFC